MDCSVPGICWFGTDARVTVLMGRDTWLVASLFYCCCPRAAAYDFFSLRSFMLKEEIFACPHSRVAVHGTA